MQRKAESGSQLLARLIARVNLSSVDPLVFRNSHCSSTETSSNHGKIIELYGTEGVGKSELALLYIAKICLPCQWKGHSLGGQSAKVSFIDTEYKFSVLHLAIIMEQIVQQYANRKQQGTKNVGLDVKTNEHIISSTKINSSSVEPCPTDSSNSFQLHENTVHMTSSTSSVLPSQNGHPCPQNSKLSSSHFVPEGEDSVVDQDKLSPLTAEDIEEIVRDSLGRLQVLRVSNTHELTATVISLGAAVSSDPLLSLVVVDTVSAYYWVDKMLSSDNSQCTEASMAPIANAIAKQVSEFGITYLVVKSALIGQKRKWCTDADPSCDKSDSSTVKSVDHVEFLGRTWGRLNVRRIVMSQKTVNGKKQVLACCPEWQQDRVFTFVDDLLHL